MKKAISLMLLFFAPLSLLAQNNAGGKLISGLSIALLVVVGLLIYMAIKLQKTQRENLFLRSKLEQQKES